MKTVSRITDRQVRLIGGVLTATVAGLVVGTVVTTPAAVPGLLPDGIAVTVTVPTTRLLANIASVAALGLGVLLLLLRDRPGKQADSARRATDAAVVGCAVGWLAALAAQVWARAAAVSPNGLALGVGEFVRYVTTIPLGRALIMSALCALLFGITGLCSVRRIGRIPTGFAVVPAVIGVLPPVLSGHPSTVGNHEVAIVSMVTHVVAAGMWVGGLGAVLIFVAPRRALLAEVLPRFARVATICLTAVALTGLANAGLRLAGLATLDLPSALIGTGYGQLVLAKALCLLVLGLLGGYLRDRMVPAIAQHRQVPLLLWAGSELTLMGLALGMASAMGNAQIT